MEGRTMAVDLLGLQTKFKALRRFERCLRGQSFFLRTGSKTVVSSVNWQEGTVSRPLSILALWMLGWAAAQDIHMSAVYVQAEQNLITDTLSKRVNVMAETALSDLAFKQIVERWGRPDVDVFAASSNAKVPRFISRDPMMGAMAAEAFSLAWTLLGYLYLFPSLPLIPLVLEKLVQDKVVRVVLVWCSKCRYAVISQNTK
uniref:Uncharacterized protein n=1 Tax=Latimeria chalumnae TaxID=7897 RepID=H3AB62_LATCH